VVAIVGYTNAGKSTLLNRLTQQESVLAEDKLFATLDPTTRRVVLPSGMEVSFDMPAPWLTLLWIRSIC
jgi:GTP-binding protein HflX